MEALEFIKKYHKKYLDKSKIDNNIYDEIELEQYSEKTINFI